MKTFSWLGLVLSALLLAGCAASGGAPMTAAPAAGGPHSDAIRVGDKITVRLSGVPSGEDYINEIQVPESGDITVPVLSQSFHAVGTLPGELANEISTAYRTSKIYNNPNVIVIPEDRFISVGGDVRSPGRPTYTPDLTLLGVINACGGFDDYADKHSVRILRGSQVYHVDCTKALTTPGEDPPVFPGDQVYVPRTIL